MSSLLSALMPYWWLALLCSAITAALAGTVLVEFAARRTVAQPLALALSEETTVLAGTLTALRRYPFIANIEPIAFAAHHHHNIWAALREVLGSYADYPDDATDADLTAAGTHLQDNTDNILTALRNHLAVHSVSPTSDLARLEELLAHGHTHGLGTAATDPRGAQADADVISAAESVIYAGKDRTDRGGLGLVVPGTNPNSLDPAHPPLVREHTAPSRLRRIAAATAGGVAGALIPGFATASGLTGAAAAAAGLTLLLLTAGTVVLALVDLDTFYIDLRTWAVTGAATSATSLATALLVGDLSRLVYGVVMAALIIGVLEGTNVVFRVFTRRDGQGFGDTLIVALTAAVPAAVAGDWRIGYWAVLAGSLCAAAAWIAARGTGRAARGGAFAFGPWLGCGWVLGMIWFVHDTLSLGSLT